MGVTARSGITCSMTGEECEGDDGSGGDNGDGGDSGDVRGSTDREGGVSRFSRSDSEGKRGGDGEAGVGSRASSAASSICTSPSAVSRGNPSSTRSTRVGISQLRLVLAAAVGALCSELKLELEVVRSEHPNSTIRQIQSEIQRNAIASIATASESAVVGVGGSDSSRASVKDGAD